MGPSAIRIARLHTALRRLGHEVDDLGNITGIEMEERQAKDETLRYLDEILVVCKRLAQKVTRAVSAGGFPLVLGGDHSLALGTAAGLAALGRNEGLLWVDAHGDFNTNETTPSGNIHGMPLAALLGHGHKRLVELGGLAPKADPKRTVLLGIRDIDAKERDLIADSGVTYFTMRDIDEQGMAKVMDQALAVVGKGGKRIHVSFDVDVMDPAYALGTGTPSPGGLTYREAHLLMEMVADTGRLTSLDLVEVNPILDLRNATAQLAVELALSALGMKIL